MNFLIGHIYLVFLLFCLSKDRLSRIDTQKTEVNFKKGFCESTRSSKWGRRRKRIKKRGGGKEKPYLQHQKQLLQLPHDLQDLSCKVCLFFQENYQVKEDSQIETCQLYVKERELNKAICWYMICSM